MLALAGREGGKWGAKLPTALKRVAPIDEIRTPPQAVGGLNRSNYRIS